MFGSRLVKRSVLYLLQNIIYLHWMGIAISAKEGTLAKDHTFPVRPLVTNTNEPTSNFFLLGVHDAPVAYLKLPHKSSSSSMCYHLWTAGSMTSISTRTDVGPLGKTIDNKTSKPHGIRSILWFREPKLFPWGLDALLDLCMCHNAPITMLLDFGYYNSSLGFWNRQQWTPR